MIRISQLKLPVDHTPDALEKKICQQLKIKKEELSSWKIVRRSLDARKKPDLKFVYVVDVDTPKERKILHRMQKVNDKNIMLTNKTEYQFPAGGTEKLKQPPVVIGSGPAGLFCAWALAKAGLRPVVYERGEKASERKKTVDQYWKDGILDPNSNVQFGEGGAGTFSDGKLNTLVKDPVGRHRKVLEIFVQGGAPDHILYEQKPHLGTDQLIGIVTSLREQIEQMGGRFCFTKQVTDLDICDGKICRIQLNRNEWIETQVCIAAVGHSARDTFSMLKRHGIYMEAKSFAVGVRIEHPQKMINLSQYGQPKVKELGAASYKLTHQLENGRGIYSFCMCPGGYVVDASSEKGYLAVNGMSYQARDSRNANSAMIVTVSPQDYVTYGMEYLQRMGEDALAAELDQNPLAGIFFQRYLEQKAYQLHEGRIPVQTTSLREQIEQMGGRFCFTKQVTDLDICDGKICRIQLNRNEWIETQVCIAAVGHSARDTFSMLKRHGIYMEAKSFAVGVRIEHPQKMINLSQYGQPKVKELGAASYKLTHQLENGRGIYSFCMCPGGYVVDASSEKGYLAVNGMSYQARDSRNANSAMIVTVSPQDYVTYGMEYLQRMGEDALAAELDQNPLAGIFFQRYLEQKAYQLHEGRIPVQTYGDFHERKETKAFGEVEPCIRGRYAMSNLREIFPDFLAESLDLGIAACGRKIHGFDRPDAILSGVESRTSSPVRISRNEQMESNVRGFYPCGEGAGYAGGITSAAMDGLRVAEAVCKKYCL